MNWCANFNDPTTIRPIVYEGWNKIYWYAIDNRGIYSISELTDEEVYDKISKMGPYVDGKDLRSQEIRRGVSY